MPKDLADLDSLESQLFAQAAEAAALPGLHPLN